jgi:hypothetical protein
MRPNINARAGTISIKSKRREAFAAFKKNQYEKYIVKENIIHPLPYGPDDDRDQAIKYITDINTTGMTRNARKDCAGRKARDFIQWRPEISSGWKFEAAM